MPHPPRKRARRTNEAAQLPPNLDTEQPLVFISHDHRDSELAEAFQNLISDASAGVVRCFRSSDKLGTTGIEYGSIWYQAVMEHLDDASAVVALLTNYSIDRPWILYEVGVAKGKLDTVVFGLVLGLPLDAASRGPFAQFQNSGFDEDSLMKLVSQIVKPYTTPREQILKGFVHTFINEVNEILGKRRDSPQEIPAGGQDSSAAKLFEEIKLLVGDIPRILVMLDRILPTPPALSGQLARGQELLTHTITIGDASHTLRFSPTWSGALRRLGWPDGLPAVKLLADIEKWFSDDPSRLTYRRKRGQIGDIGFMIIAGKDGTTTLSQFRRIKEPLPEAS